MIWIILTCVLALALIVMCFYVRFLLFQLSFLVENKKDLIEAIDDFCSHIRVLHNNRLFYGDPLFIKLMKHGNKLTEYLKTYGEIYDMLDDEYEYDTIDDEEELYSYEKSR